jgi:hypothetical protein
LPPEQAKLAHLQEFPSGEDLEAADGPFAMQLVGDSHAVHYLAGLSPILKRLGIKLEPLAYPGCPILYGVRLKKTFGDYAFCVKSQDHALERIGKTNLPIILVQRWQFYDDATIDFAFDGENDSHSGKYSYTKLEHALERTIGQITRGGRQILIIGSQVDATCFINLPRLLEGPLPHAALPPCPPTSREAVEKFGAAINQMLARVQAKWPDRIRLLRPIDYLCDMECPTVKGGIWLYRDSNHFTVAGSNYMVQLAEKPIVEFLVDTRTPG